MTELIQLFAWWFTYNGFNVYGLVILLSVNSSSTLPQGMCACTDVQYVCWIYYPFSVFNQILLSHVASLLSICAVCILAVQLLEMGF